MFKINPLAPFLLFTCYWDLRIRVKLTIDDKNILHISPFLWVACCHYSSLPGSLAETLISTCSWHANITNTSPHQHLCHVFFFLGNGICLSFRVWFPWSCELVHKPLRAKGCLHALIYMSHNRFLSPVSSHFNIIVCFKAKSPYVICHGLELTV